MKKTNFFEKDLESINKSEILSLITKLKKNFPRFNDGCQDESIDESLKAHKNPTLHSLKIQSKIRYPIYDNGSFREDIDNFLNESINSTVRKLFIKIEAEISKVYKGYLTIEDILYEKIVALLNFYENKEEFSKLQIISRIKEISEILEETYNFIKNYLIHNFNILKTIFENMDKNLNKYYNVKSLSLIFLLKYFELPNNELSYMLIFKIFDEETLILYFLLNEFKKQIKSNDSIESNIISLEKDNNLMNRESNNIFNDENEDEKNETLNVMLDLMDNYINKAHNISNKINEIYSYRALYYNYYIYLRGNYNIDSKNKLLSNSLITEEESSSINTSELSELISINSLMDEEVIIKHFLNKKIIKEFLSSFKKNLRLQYKINKILIIINCIQYYSILPLIIFNHNNDITKYKLFNKIYLYLISYNAGLLSNKIIFKSCLSKKLSLKAILLINNICLFISFSLLLFNFCDDNEKKEKYLLVINRFLYGLSNSKIIASKFLITYEPKLIVINSIKFFFRLKYLSLFFIIIYISIINIIFAGKRNINVKDKIINYILKSNHPSECIFLIVIFINMIINIFLFRNIKLKDIIKRRESFEKIIIKSDKNILTKKSSIFESTSSDLSKVSDDQRSVISFGKSKLISYKNRRKAKKLDKQFKSAIQNENYEGTNQIFEEIDQIILKQNNCCSYINKNTFGLIFVMMLICINNEILMLLISFNDDSKVEMIFSFSFIIGYILLNFKNYFFKNSRNNISYLNIIVLITLLLESLLYIIMSVLYIIVKSKLIISILSIIIAILNVLLENMIAYLMSTTIPIEKKIFNINIGKFIDLIISLFKIFSLVSLLIIKITIIEDSVFSNNFMCIQLSLFYCVLQSIIFYIFNFRSNYCSLSRIMNKISYEK